MTQDLNQDKLILLKTRTVEMFIYQYETQQKIRIRITS